MTTPLNNTRYVPYTPSTPPQVHVMENTSSTTCKVSDCFNGSVDCINSSLCTGGKWCLWGFGATAMTGAFVAATPWYVPITSGAITTGGLIFCCLREGCELHDCMNAEAEKLVGSTPEQQYHYRLRTETMKQMNEAAYRRMEDWSVKARGH